MVRNLQDIKDEQEELRKTIIDCYKDSQSSMQSLAHRIGIPYTTLRSFMLGGALGFKNIFKIKEWLSK